MPVVQQHIGPSSASCSLTISTTSNAVVLFYRKAFQSSRLVGSRRKFMCGIVGILGRQPVALSIIEALKRLEYRGYDSAGLATLENGRLTRVRAGGKLRNLEEKLASKPLS